MLVIGGFCTGLALEPEACGQHGGGDGIGGEVGGEIHHQLLGGKQHAGLLHAGHPTDGGLYLAGAAGAVHAQHLPAMAATVLGRRSQGLGAVGDRLMIMTSMVAMVMSRLRVTATLTLTTSSGGLFIPR